MAVTRFSVHAGLFGMYLIRDEIEDALQLPAGDQELVLAIADRNLESEPGPTEQFRPTGRLLYKQAGIAPNNADEEAEVAQSGPFTMVNGKIWPTHEVDARWHRLRLLNASNSRIYRLALYDTTDEEPIPDDADDLAGQPGGGFGNDPDAYGMHRLDGTMPWWRSGPRVVCCQSRWCGRTV